MARSQKKKKKKRLLWYGEEEKEMGACRAERMDGPSGDGTNEKGKKKKSQNRITEITFSSSFSRSLKSQLKRKKKFTNNK